MGIALSMHVGAKGPAVTRPRATQGGGWGLRACPDLERVLLLARAAGEVAVLEHGS